MFAARLKELRSRENVTQEELAKIIGVERSTVGKYESAKKEVIPSVDVLSRIADFFQVSTDYLLGRTNDPTDYDNGDLIAEIPSHILEAFSGNVKKAVEFRGQVDGEALSEKPSRVLGAAAHLDLSNPEAIAEYNKFLEYLAYKYKDK